MQIAERVNSLASEVHGDVDKFILGTDKINEGFKQVHEKVNNFNGHTEMITGKVAEILSHSHVITENIMCLMRTSEETSNQVETDRYDA